MSVAIVTGSAGLIGSEAVGFLHEQGMDVVGVDNDMRAYFFGSEASTRWNRDRLTQSLPHFFSSQECSVVRFSSSKNDFVIRIVL